MQSRIDKSFFIKSPFSGLISVVILRCSVGFLRTSQAGKTRKAKYFALNGLARRKTTFLRLRFSLWEKSLRAFLSFDHGSTVHKYAYASCSKLFPHPLRLLFKCFLRTSQAGKTRKAKYFALNGLARR